MQTKRIRHFHGHLGNMVSMVEIPKDTAMMPLKVRRNIKLWLNPLAARIGRDFLPVLSSPEPNLSKCNITTKSFGACYTGVSFETFLETPFSEFYCILWSWGASWRFFSSSRKDGLDTTIICQWSVPLIWVGLFKEDCWIQSFLRFFQMIWIGRAYCKEDRHLFQENKWRLEPCGKNNEFEINHRHVRNAFKRPSPQ